MRTVTIFGGSGFIGRYLVEKFAQRGDQIRIAVRDPIQANFLKPLGEVGQITPVQATLLSEDSIVKAIDGSDVVINLVGILNETGSQTFEGVHHEGAKAVANIASKAKVEKLLHMSALGANKESPSIYARTKEAGERAVLKHFPTATIFRPSVIFGPEDDFLNRFANMALISPFLPLIGGGHTRFQPLYVGDIADAFVKASLAKTAQGKTYECGGPSIYSFKEVMEFLLKTIRRKRLLIPLPFEAAKFISYFAQYFPGAPITPDQVELLRADNIVSVKAHTIHDLDIEPKAMEAMAPYYLIRYCPKGKA